MNRNRLLLSYLKAWVQGTSYQPAIILSGESFSTKRMIDQVRSMGALEDVINVIPEEGRITMKQVRFLLTRSRKTGWHGYRLIIINEAEKLTAPAEQAMLKFLEEPQEKIRILLSTQWPRRLAATFRSRCLIRRVLSEDVLSVEAKLANDVLTRFAQYKGDSRLTDDVLTHIAFKLDHKLRAEGPSASLRRAMVRLRDYYLISGSPAGNVKLARDVLLAALPD